MTVVFDFLNISNKTVLSLALRKCVVPMLTVQSILLPTLGLRLTAPTGKACGTMLQRSTRSTWQFGPMLHDYRELFRGTAAVWNSCTRESYKC